MTRLGEVCAELATLWPALAAALRRDTVPAAAGGTQMSSLVNADVLHAMMTLKTGIPATAAQYVTLTGEPWQPRDLPAWLTAIPRIGARLETLNHVGALAELTAAAAGWLRLTKQALGLRTPDIPIGYGCPFGEDHPGAVLLAQGSEGFLRRSREGVTVEWEHAARIFCPGCGAGWGPGEWLLLGQLIGAGKVAS